MTGSYVLGLPRDTKLWMVVPMIGFLIVGTVCKLITYRVLKKEKDRPVNILIWFNQVVHLKLNLWSEQAKTLRDLRY